ncbi:MAG TPA: NCS2 family permease [Candidatus Acidoferrales bacterium]|jgi:AGZA family xanthine/uracil permease-like MFS transporter|nr:NCS2 family permease [Candidatus Acidoferrales bacterium]
MSSTETTVLPAQSSVIERIFHVAENNSTISRELLGGLTTFMAMAYVVVVNPRILGEAGMPVDGVLFATCLSAAVATLVMGIWANYPIALAPGMSLNAYFTYSIVLGRHVPWQTALGVVFLSGSLFLILTLTNVREHIVNDIPDCLKHGTAAGIGFFIAFIGMRNANMIVANPATYVGIGKIADPHVLLAALGLIVIAILMSRKVGGAILIGIVVTALAGIPLKLTSLPSHLFSLPHPAGTFMKMDFRSAARLGLGELIFVFFFVDLFDNVGTLVGVCEQGGFMRDGKFPRASRALLADAFGTMIGAITGTSTVTSYIESAAGVAAGARTGLGNLVIAGLFLGAMFCAPVVAAIPSYATAPALILVGALMCTSLPKIKWDDFTDAFPAFMTMVATPLTFSIATGLSLGLLSFTFLKVGTGRVREISPLIWILTVLFVLRYAFLGAE